jgi:hypothetical protein
MAWLTDGPKGVNYDLDDWDSSTARASMRVIARSVGASVFAAFISATASAQTVRGVVVDQSATPVPGVVVQLLDSASRVAGRALSNERGEFRVAATRAGTYRLGTLRIGYRPTVSEPISLVSGGEIEHRVTLSGVRVALDTMRVVSNNICRAFTDSGAATYRVWEQVRTALTATQLTAAARAVSATTVAYERTLDASGRRVQKQSWNIRSDYVKQPWLSMSPDSLHRLGYVVTTRDNSIVYYAPGLDMLLSNVFVEDHCFRLRTDKNRLGIAFEPAPDRKDIGEIRGTLWVDRTSSQLERIEFRYVNLTPEQEDQAGGDMDFAHMKNGTWAVSRWNIRMPVIEQRIRSQAMGGNALHVTEVRVAGGELALARRGNDTLWSRPPLVLAATILDSTSGSSIAKARVVLAGTQLEGTADARGRVSIANVLPGQYTLEIHTPSLDSVSAVHQAAISFTDSASAIQIKVPTAQQIGALLCGNRQLDNPGMVLGTLVTKGDTTPPRNVRVFAEWDELSLRNAAGNAVTEKQHRAIEARTDAKGGFRFCGVPVNTAMRLRPEEAAGDAAPIDVKIPVNGRFARAELTVERSSGAAFVGFVVADSTQQPLIGAEVSLPKLGKTVLSNERGAFRISDIPTGTHQVTVRRVGYGALDTQVAFVSGNTLDRRIVLSRAVTLDSVVVRAEAIASFEEHRKLGLGHFLTRTDLAKVEGRRLSDVLNTMPGLKIMPGKGSHAWVRSSHALGGVGASMKTNPGANVMPDAADSAAGAHAVPCYSQVYLDNHLMFSGRKTLDPVNPTAPNATRQFRFDPLFDINSIAPEQIEAIEYYSGAAEVPLKYSNTNSDCGVIVIHTRRSR